MKLHFGKHRGKELHQIPRGYLRWLEKQDISDDLKADINYAIAIGDSKPLAERVTYQEQLNNLLEQWRENYE